MIINNKWTLEEVKFLKDNYPTKGFDFCISGLNRSKGSIEAKRKSLKLNRVNYKKDTELYLEELVSKNITCYPIDDYIEARVPILHGSLNCKHRWNARPDNILQYKGCPFCANDNNQPCYLYFVSFIYGIEKFYKIGITIKDNIKQRFSSDWHKFDMKLLWNIKLESGAEAYELEQSIIDDYQNHFVNLGVLRSGNTETLTEYLPIEIAKRK